MLTNGIGIHITICISDSIEIKQNSWTNLILGVLVEVDQRQGAYIVSSHLQNTAEIQTDIDISLHKQ